MFIELTCRPGQKILFNVKRIRSVVDLRYEATNYDVKDTRLQECHQCIIFLDSLKIYVLETYDQVKKLLQRGQNAH
jgi:hypothetical protein